MGTASNGLAGTHDGVAFHSACHAATRAITGRKLRHELEEAGIAVRAASQRGLAEEAPFSYKDVDEIVDCREHAGLARRVARLRPLGVVKG
ncbi:RtcB family protein [Pseudonocardia bannensis]|uniref:3'-phosphate/5'-hydroxy nucleic acid ligase n=2 Tax=Pseudonocardia bannensis TaxID=630973 RepID=A0A848DF85_9PSEU|nr:RtcB family protein [Pseudonocardia bannensis]